MNEYNLTTLGQEFDSHSAKGVLSVLPYGIKFLDKALGGIFPNDLILIAARSGQGKTEFAAHLALNTAMLGKRVMYFALEAHKGEMGSRMLFRLASRMYFKSESRPRLSHELRYLNFYRGLLNDDLGEYIEAARHQLMEVVPNLSVVYRREEFTVDTFISALAKHHKDHDMFIIDHLNYFDYSEKSETEEVTKIVKQIRDVVLMLNKPVILVSHVRKKDRKDKGLVPDIEDVFGTSNVYKIATAAIMLAPDWDGSEAGHDKIKTFMHIAKSRLDGALTRYLARVTFDRSTNSYEDGFELSSYKPGMEEFVGLTEKLPNWAGHYEPKPSTREGPFFK